MHAFSISSLADDVSQNASSFQGTSASALRLSAPSGSDIPETVRSTNHALRVVFLSDYSIEQGGFLANAVCVEDDSG